MAASPAFGPMGIMDTNALAATWGAGNNTTTAAGSASNCTGPSSMQWTNRVFGECVLDDLQMAGFLLGLLSNVCWFVAQSPQIYLNFKKGKAEGLSFAFLAIWLTGDITNLVGCLLTQQVPTQLITAIYFCVVDSTMMLQWLYYNKMGGAKAKPHFSSRVNAFVLPVVAAVGLALPAAAMYAAASGSPDGAAGAQHYGRTLLSAEAVSAVHITATDTRNGLIGYIIGSVSGLMYFASRMPQIYQNFQRKSCEGLSPIMFLMAVCGNAFYGCGVLMEGHSTTFILNHLPWLVGSIGTLLFDFTILVQYFKYGTPEDKVAHSDYEEQPLL